jgi:hypothetical protein
VWFIQTLSSQGIQVFGGCKECSRFDHFQAPRLFVNTSMSLAQHKYSHPSAVNDMAADHMLIRDLFDFFEF